MQVYRDSLLVNCYTEKIPEFCDIIKLVEFYKDMSFFKSMTYICEVCGWEYYSDYKKDNSFSDPCISFLDSIEPNREERNEIPLRKINESSLNVYLPYPHMSFLEEGISVPVQKQFEIGYDLNEEYISIPIRDELGSLVGVKARTLKDYKRLHMPKYWYPIPTPKSQILYGLDKNYESIKKAGSVIVFEAEKSVMKANTFGICNSVSIGGHELSRIQVDKLERLGVDIILAMDNNISPKEVKKEAEKFIIRNRLYGIVPIKNKGLLGEKDAPVDKGKELFLDLLDRDKYKIKL